MKVVAAYLMAVLGGNSNPSGDDLKKILASVGAEADDGLIDLLLREVKDKDINEVIAAGRERMAASVPTAAGGVAAAPAAGGEASPGAAAETKKEEKKKEEVMEESDDDNMFSLFD